MRKRGFTILELVIVLIVLVVLISAALFYYNNYIAKARSGEAIVNIGAIKKGEEVHKVRTGTYVNAANADEINEILSVGIKPRFYEYIVVGASADNFLVVAKLIGEDLNNYAGAGVMPSGNAVIAMDKSGSVSSSELFATTGGLASSDGGGSSGTSGWGGVGGVTFWTGGVGGGTGGAGGGTGGGTGGGLGVPPYTPGGTITDGPSTVPVVYDADIQAAMDKFAGDGTVFQYYSQCGVTLAGDSGSYYYDVIKNNNINVAYMEMDSSTLGYWSASNNLIAINQSLKTEAGWPTEAISAIIMHEATHADYTYNPATWINRITTLWPQDLGPFNVDPAKLVDPLTGGLYYSITEEYFTNANEAQLWKEYQASYAGVAGAGIDFEDGKVARFEQGEAAVRAYLVAIPAYNSLPEFYPGN